MRILGKRYESSTARNPFSFFREYTGSLSIDESVLADTPWTSSACRDFFIFWEDVPPIVRTKNFGLANSLANLYAESELPLATVLVSLAINMFKLLQQIRAAPTTDELAEQFSALKRQLEGLASLAQGGKAKGIATVCPSWMQTAAEPNQDEVIENSMRDAAGRSASLHPNLHDILFLALQRAQSDLLDDIAYWANDAFQRKEQRKIQEFFETIAEIRDLVEEAERICRSDFPMPNMRERSPGAPGDEAKDWLLVRLLWIWRDVLGQEIKIYARKIENGVELDSPKPNDCMDFVISVMRHVAPVRPHQIPALERKLTELKNLVPVEPLAILDV